MKNVYKIGGLLSLVLGLLFSSPTIAQTADNFIPGELIVQMEYQEEVEKLVADMNKQMPGLEMEVEQMLCKSINIWLLTFDYLTVPTNDALIAVSKHYDVSVAQFNHNDIKLRDTLPNDPQVGSQWAFDNTDTTGANNAVGISAQKAWMITTGGTTSQGDDIVMAVIDGGFDINHEDIEWWSNSAEIPGNGQDDDGNGYVDDVNGWNAYNNNGNITSSSHGTHVAGTVAAKGNNSIGVTGVNWHGHVMAIQGSSGSEATVVAAYGYALDNRRLYRQTNGAQGAFVVSTNSSFGVDNANPNSYPIWCNFYDSLGAEGIISCGATANNSVNIDAVGDVPTACPSDWLISVTNTNENDQRAFAGYGATTIDLGAPGSGILSTYPNDGYNSISGTSMATPHVAGTIGLMISAGCPGFIDAYKMYPDSMALIIIDMLLDNVDPVASLSGECVTGGRLNLYKAVRAVAEWSCTPIVLNTSIVDATCTNANGSATVIVTGNVGPVISYLWDDQGAQTTATATGLAAGSYTVTVVDSAGNMNDIGVTIANSNSPTVAISSVALLCYGNASGEATANATGGTPAFTYLWDDGLSQTTQTATGLDAGVYNVTVTDASGCVVMQSVELNEPAGLGASSGVTGNTADPSNGSIALNTAGGTPPYTYLWSNGETTEDITGLFQGNYDVTITDANGCTWTNSYTVGGNINVAELDASMSIELYPNPSDGAFRVLLTDANPAIYNVELTNIIGEVISIQNVDVTGGSATIDFDLKDKASGIYFIKVSDEQQRSRTMKMIVK
jgi:subtilisin family serine protease